MCLKWPSLTKNSLNGKTHIHKKKKNALQKCCSQDGTTVVSLEGQQKNICTQNHKQKGKKHAWTAVHWEKQQLFLNQNSK